MDHFELQPLFDQAELGRSLAKLHSHPAGDRFGFEVDNTIGGTPQQNGWLSDWVEFFVKRRLQPQLKRTQDAEAQRLGELVIARIPSLFAGLHVKPSLLHGDLWSGNIGGHWPHAASNTAASGNGAPVARASVGSPVLIDPACYYGHSEAEFGMAWCATFSPAFWEAYHAIIPRQPGEEERRRLYTLYHVINHWNLFGGGYREKAFGLLHSLAKSPA